MAAKARLLFVSHSATRNGATILLLEILRWLQQRTDFRLEVLVNGRGELVEEFRSICPTMIWRNTDRVFAPLPLGLRSGLNRWLLTFRTLGRSYDLVYFNTASTAPHMSVLSRRSRTVLWHIHELEYALRKSIADGQIDQLLPLATRFIVVSQSVRQTLISKFEVCPDKIDLVHGCVSLPGGSAVEAQAIRKRIHDHFRWPQNAFVVGGCGALGWRKGTDLFLQIASISVRSDASDRTRFLWVGGGSEDEQLRFEHDVKSLGLQERCCYVAATPSVADYYHAMNAFALTSREDPFPLVMLEAAARNLPVICFAGSGGGPEFVGTDAGFTVPYLDVAGFAQCLEELRNSPQLCHSRGTVAAARVCGAYGIRTQCPKTLESIERCLASTSQSTLRENRTSSS